VNADWRDVQALAELDSPAARRTLLIAAEQGSLEIQLAINKYAPKLIDEKKRAARLVEGLKSPRLSGGWSQALDATIHFHPPEVIAALLRETRYGSSQKAVNFAAMLMYLHGKAQEPFDMELRPFFLQFGTDDPAEREAAFLALCEQIGVNPQSISD
jgi:hypothetical protein